MPRRHRQAVPAAPKRAGSREMTDTRREITAYERGMYGTWEAGPAQHEVSPRLLQGGAHSVVFHRPTQSARGRYTRFPLAANSFAFWSIPSATFSAVAPAAAVPPNCFVMDWLIFIESSFRPEPAHQGSKALSPTGRAAVRRTRETVSPPASRGRSADPPPGVLRGRTRSPELRRPYPGVPSPCRPSSGQTGTP